MKLVLSALACVLLSSGFAGAQNCGNAAFGRETNACATGGGFSQPRFRLFPRLRGGTYATPTACAPQTATGGLAACGPLSCAPAGEFTPAFVPAVQKAGTYQEKLDSYLSRPEAVTLGLNVGTGPDAFTLTFLERFTVPVGYLGLAEGAYTVHKDKSGRLTITKYTGPPKQ